MRIIALALSIFAFFHALPAWALDGKPIYARPVYSVPFTSPTIGEGKQVLNKLTVGERQVLMTDGLVISHNLDQVEQGQEVKGVIKAYIVVKQPRATAFKLLTEPSRQATYIPRLESSKTVVRKGNSEKTEFLVKVSVISIHSRVNHEWWPELSRIAWMLDPDFKNDLRQQVGFFNIYSLDANTSLLEFGTRLEISALVPQAVQEYLTRRDLPESLASVKKWLDSGGTWKKKLSRPDAF